MQRGKNRVDCPLRGGDDAYINPKADHNTVKCFNPENRYLGIHFKDMQCGFKIFSAHAARTLFQNQVVGSVDYWNTFSQIGSMLTMLNTFSKQWIGTFEVGASILESFPSTLVRSI